MLFNARSETAAEKVSFREAWARRRALLPVTGWWEWRDGQRYLVRRRDGKPVVMAALWEGDRFTVLTCRAGENLAWLHERAPVVLLKRDWEGWLRGEAGVGLMRPFPAGALVARSHGPGGPNLPPTAPDGSGRDSGTDPR